jgi:tripartite ATP-independent transporter DctM subunit
MPLYRAMGDITWNSSSEYILIAIPMFVMLGEVLLRSGIAVRVYNAIAKWLSWLPGGLMHANIGTCAIFAATSGSSVATAATVGVVALPQIKIRGYDEPLFLGTLAAGGTLGILIPPSINFILYGLITSTSVPRLYLAGMIPGLLLTSFFMLIVLIYCLVSPEKGGAKLETSWAIGSPA